jgi:hypothetical protein
LDLDILVLDERGEVVATSMHAGLIMGTERNLAGRKGEDGEKGGKNRWIKTGKGSGMESKI